MFGVVVIDDHPVFAEALAKALEAQPAISTARTAIDYQAARRALDNGAAEVFVVDAELGGGESIGQLAELLNGDRERQAVVMVETETVEVATAAVKAGALAVMAKSAPLTSLVDAVLGVARGEGYLSPRLLAAVLGRLWEEEHEARATAALFNALTQREQDVLRLMIEGLDYPAIARELYSSVNTVRTHAQSLLRKLGVHSGIEAVSLARRVGWGSGRPSAT